MVENFDKKYFIFCKFRCSFILSNTSPRKKVQNNHTLKAPAMVSIYQYEVRLQAVDVVGIDKASIILPHCAMPMICFVFG